MVFASHAFIAFLAAVVGFFWLLSRFHPRAGMAWIILASLLFYAYWSPVYLLLLAASIVGTFAAVRGMLATRNPRLHTMLLVSGITFNIGLLAYFKYFAFLIESLNIVAATDLRVPEIVLPIGLSFWTFQQIGLLVDTGHGRLTKLRFWDHVFLIAFFPHQIAGPILSQHELLPQLAAIRRWFPEPRKVAAGAALFAAGLFKKTVLIDPFSRHVDAIYAVAQQGDSLGMLDGWAAAFGYGFQIYFDFSAYSDMAIGLAYIFGIRLPLNFFSPYKAASIREFWRRWHVTLSRMLQRLLYIPMGGSRHGLARTVAALLGTMAIGGLWHGAGWNFVIWGLLHGLFLSLNHLWIHFVGAYAAALRDKLRASPVLAPVVHAASVLLTFVAVSFAWVFFRAPDFDTAIRITGAMLGLSDGSGLAWITDDMLPRLLPYFLIVWCLPNTMQLFRGSGAILHIEDYGSPGDSNLLERRFSFRQTTGWAVGSALIFLSAWYAMSDLSPFIYFQF
ncbi:MAG: MBOAT family protein [Gammaproteobacteria bacterium]|nr:MBOAT family protein [Gammaproteobacteria bacterium]